MVATVVIMKLNLVVIVANVMVDRKFDLMRIWWRLCCRRSGWLFSVVIIVIVEAVVTVTATELYFRVVWGSG